MKSKINNALQAVIFSLCFANFAFAAPKAIPLKEVALPKAKLKQLCQQLPNGCGESSTTFGVYTDKHNFYFIEGGKQIALLEKTPNFFSVKTIWDFSHYQHSYTPEEYGVEGVEIYPALYPLNAEKKAIAILKQEVEPYAGGGRVEQTADFVELKPDGSYAVALTSIPFYKNTLIRTCFTAEEYEKNRYCHDEESSVLSIKFHEGTPYYRWDLTYTDTTIDTSLSESNVRKVTKSKPISVVPYQAQKQ